MLLAHLRDFVVNDRRIKVDEESGILGMRLDLLNVPRPPWPRTASIDVHKLRTANSVPAFDSAPIVLARISNVVFAALAVAAVWIAARRIRLVSVNGRHGGHSR